MSTEQYEHIDDVISECQDAVNIAVRIARECMHLKEHGVLYVDKELNPVVPDNVLLFPAARRIQ